MTENKCIENLNILVHLWEDDENMYSNTLEIEIDQEFMDCIYKSIEVLKEIQKYQAIGTIAELMDLKTMKGNCGRCRSWKNIMEKLKNVKQRCKL